MKTNYLLFALVLITALLLGGCGSQARVGALQTESQSVELGDAKSVRVDINFALATCSCRVVRKSCWRPTSSITSPP